MSQGDWKSEPRKHQESREEVAEIDRGARIRVHVVVIRGDLGADQVRERSEQKGRDDKQRKPIVEECLDEIRLPVRHMDDPPEGARSETYT